MLHSRFSLVIGFIHSVSRWLSGKESACKAGDMGPVPVSGRPSGGRHGSLLQYSRLENPMDREVWWATVRVAKSQTVLKQLSVHADTYSLKSFLSEKAL